MPESDRSAGQNSRPSRSTLHCSHVFPSGEPLTSIQQQLNWRLLICKANDIIKVTGHPSAHHLTGFHCDVVKSRLRIGLEQSWLVLHVYTQHSEILQECILKLKGNRYDILLVNIAQNTDENSFNYIS